jgi:hypothetical protein
VTEEERNKNILIYSGLFLLLLLGAANTVLGMFWAVFWGML